jgi:hypothetical protein
MLSGYVELRLNDLVSQLAFLIAKKLIGREGKKATITISTTLRVLVVLLFL